MAIKSRETSLRSCTGRLRRPLTEHPSAISIGEAQHAIAAGTLKEADITPIGDVINGNHKGRSSDDEITLFDGTGVGLQDLAVASVAAKLADEQGLAKRVAL